ncbi:MAG TPA: hypothetical protein DHU96_08600 [Actinobacteria bacterium]|nr:hypothetical protein [Actinomycetota bacterium]
MNWWSAAACRSADPELFSPTSNSGPCKEQAERAKAVCAAVQAPSSVRLVTEREGNRE